LKALIDGDILRYEVGYAAEIGWRSITDGRETVPPFDYVERMLNDRLAYICQEAKADEKTIYLSEGPTFRDKIAQTKPYKGTRVDKKPWHFKNLTVYLKDILGAQVVKDIEADDQMAIDHAEDTIICTRDKDLRQVPGMFYSWELGKQPSFGPTLIDKEGAIELEPKSNTIRGTGLAFFYSQLLTGDPVDNIPGLPRWGPVKAFKWLEQSIPSEYLTRIQEAYGSNTELLLEQGRLLWMTRRLNEDGSPVLWEIGMEE